jgi:Uma2 family endonuclease
VRARSTETWERSKYDGQRMSEAEYLALPEEKPYLEYVDGVVVQKAMGNRDHGRLGGELAVLLGLYAREHGGEMVIEQRTRVEPRRSFLVPDVAYYREGTNVEDAAPALAIEIRSPDETIDSQRRKCRVLRENSEACWLVIPRTRTIEVFDADNDGAVMSVGDVVTTLAAPGLEIDIAALFKVLDR